MKTKGFTLIELLVVIAIIGILSAIVLASLDSARSKGQDAAARADLDDARAQAENFYDSSTNSYGGVCITAANATKPGIADMMQGAASAEGSTVTYSIGNNAVSSTAVVCHDSSTSGLTWSGTTGWVAATPLKNAVNGMSFWCVDNTGTSTPVSALAVGAQACP